MQSVAVTSDDLELAVHYAEGDQVDEDFSCDSTIVLGIIPKIEHVLQNAFHWVQWKGKSVCSFITRVAMGLAIAQYTNMLWNGYRMKIFWQVRYSLDTTMLNPGISMCILASQPRITWSSSKLCDGCVAELSL